jgi:tetratricopeptide (TPR) repeat protein
MRLALVISSAYAENTVVPCREAFRDNSTLFAERIGIADAGFEVRTLDASRELPETLETLLKEQSGKIESLLVHFTGYVAVKADRGPALLLDGSRLRAFPLSRLRAAIEEGAQQSLVVIDALPVVDANQPAPEVSTAVCDALASPDGSVTSLVGIEEEWSLMRRGVLRLTDLFALSLSHWTHKARGGLVTSTAIYQTMQGDVLSFASIPGLEHRPGYFDFVVLEGPQVGGVVEAHFGQERATKPVPVFQPPAPTDPSAQPQVENRATSERSLPAFSLRSDNAPVMNAPALNAPALNEADRLPSFEDVTGGDAPPNVPEFPAHDQPLVRSPEGRSPTLAETPQARASVQREWVSEAAYFPSAPPPKVVPVQPLAFRHPQGTLPGLHDHGTERDATIASETRPFEPENDKTSREDEQLRPTPLPPRAMDAATRRAMPPSLPPEDGENGQPGTSVIALYEELLDNLDPSDDPRRAEVHAKLGDALRETHRRAEALFAYERALDIDPHQEAAFDGACALYRLERDYAGLVSTIRRKLEATRDDNVRLALQDLIAYVWLHEARDYSRAIEALEERLSITPDDIETVERLIEAQDHLGDLIGRLESRERLAKNPKANPELRAALWIEAATLAHDELDDLARTFTHLEAALELKAKIRETLDATEALLGGRERWLEVIELYERAIELLTEPELSIFVSLRLVQLVLEQSAQDALKPDTLASLIRLSAIDRNLAEATSHLVRTQTTGPESFDVVQSLRQADPRNVTLLHQLFELSQHEHLDVAANVASVLCAEGAASEAETNYAQSLFSDSLPTPQRALENADYESLVFPSDFDREMAIALDELDQALIGADVFVLKNAISLPKETPILDPETSTVTLARSFLWTSRLLSVSIPELAIVSDAMTPLKLVLEEKRPRIIVSKALASGFSLPELAYLAARHATLLLPGLAIRDHSSDHRMLGSALYVLGTIANGSSRSLKSLGEYEQKLGKRLSSQIEKNPRLSSEVTRLVGNANASPTECEARAWHWLRAVDQIRLRVALLACGNPVTALKLNREYPLDGPYSSDEQLDIIAAFAGSPEHCELRSRLGIAQQHAQ